jgi:hypothetical protein
MISLWPLACSNWSASSLNTGFITAALNTLISAAAASDPVLARATPNASAVAGMIVLTMTPQRITGLAAPVYQAPPVIAAFIMLDKTALPFLVTAITGAEHLRSS